jgi:UDP-glucose 4-epimerase
VYGLGTVCLRYFNVFGRNQDPASQYSAVIPRFISAMREGRSPTIYGTGEQSRDFTHIDNVVEANLLAMDAPDAWGQVFNIACGTPHSLNELVRILNQLLGSDTAAVHAARRAGDVERSWADISRAGQVLGYAPIVDFEQGLRLTVEGVEENAGVGGA